ASAANTNGASSVYWPSLGRPASAHRRASSMTDSTARQPASVYMRTSCEYQKLNEEKATSSAAITPAWVPATLRVRRYTSATSSTPKNNEKNAAANSVLPAASSQKCSSR